MPRPGTPRRPPDEHSAGAVVWRRAPTRGIDVCLICVGQAWSLPKGNLDAGETSAEAALREVSEETGLPPDALQIDAELPPSEYAYRRRDSGRLVFKRVDHFLVRLTRPDAPLRAQAEEIDEAAWVPIDQAERRVSYGDLRTVLAEARRLLEAIPDGHG